MAGRITQVSSEVAFQQASRARVTQVSGEAIFQQNSRLRTGTLFAEVVRSVIASPSATLVPGVFEDLTPSYDWDNHYNRVLVEYTGRSIGPKSVIYRAQEPVVLHPGENEVVTIKLDQAAESVDTPVANVDYFPGTAGGMDTSASTTLSMSACAQKVELTFTNSGSFFTTFITGLQLVGLPVMGQFSNTIAASSGCSIDQYGQMVMEFPDNPLIQDRVTARFVAEFLTDRLEAPRRVITVRGVPGSAGAMPGVKTTYAELTRTGVSGSGFISQVNWRLGAGFAMDIVITTDDLFIYDDYLELDVEKCDGTARIWY